MRYFELGITHRLINEYCFKRLTKTALRCEHFKISLDILLQSFPVKTVKYKYKEKAWTTDEKYGEDYQMDLS